jgi:hypothetical protein
MLPWEIVERYKEKETAITGKERERDVESYKEKEILACCITVALQPETYIMVWASVLGWDHFAGSGSTYRGCRSGSISISIMCKAELYFIP